MARSVRSQTARAAPGLPLLPARPAPRASVPALGRLVPMLRVLLLAMRPTGCVMLCSAMSCPCERSAPPLAHRARGHLGSRAAQRSRRDALMGAHTNTHTHTYTHNNERMHTSHTRPEAPCCPEFPATVPTVKTNGRSGQGACANHVEDSSSPPSNSRASESVTRAPGTEGARQYSCRIGFHCKWTWLCCW